MINEKWRHETSGLRGLLTDNADNASVEIQDVFLG